MSAEADWHGRRLHFVGAGGTGMSGLARVCAQLGAVVTGSDRARDPGLEGVPVGVGHAAANVPEQGELVYSSAVPAGNVERARARDLGLRELRRGDLLAELARLRRCIAIAGTHGKTTTAWMTVHAMRSAGLRPSYVIGAPLRDGSPSSEWRAGEWLVVETDESDRTFLAFAPEIGVVTNVALEHMREYRTREALEAAFAEFGSRCGTVLTQPERQVGDLRLGPAGSRFRWRRQEVELPVPGAHNAANAAAALEACRLAGLDPAVAVAALRDYPGARRRLEPVGRSAGGAQVFDDYAIHANEIRASLAALRTLTAGRIVAVFEPLLYSRTQEMAPELGAALSAADEVVVLDVFAGSEAGEDGGSVSGQIVADAVAGPPAFWVGAAQTAARHLESRLCDGDACVVMGVSAAPQAVARALVAGSHPGKGGGWGTSPA
jgi:UDP-N-acetylmuramate--alanine ligase